MDTNSRAAVVAVAPWRATSRCVTLQQSLESARIRSLSMDQLHSTHKVHLILPMVSIS